MQPQSGRVIGLIGEGEGKGTYPRIKWKLQKPVRAGKNYTSEGELNDKMKTKLKMAVRRIVMNCADIKE